MQASGTAQGDVYREKVPQLPTECGSTAAGSPSLTPPPATALCTSSPPSPVGPHGDLRRYGAPKSGGWPYLSVALRPLLGHAPLPRPHSPALPTAGWRPPPRGRAEGPAGGGVDPPAAAPPKVRTNPAAAPRRPLSAAPQPASASCAALPPCARPGQPRPPPGSAAGQRRWLQHFRVAAHLLGLSGRPCRSSMVGLED